MDVISVDKRCVIHERPLVLCYDPFSARRYWSCPLDTCASKERYSPSDRKRPGHWWDKDVPPPEGP